MAILQHGLSDQSLQHGPLSKTQDMISDPINLVTRAFAFEDSFIAFDLSTRATSVSSVFAFFERLAEGESVCVCMKSAKQSSFDSTVQFGGRVAVMESVNLGLISDHS